MYDSITLCGICALYHIKAKNGTKSNRQPGFYATENLRSHEDPCLFVKVIVKKMSGTFFYWDTVYVN